MLKRVLVGMALVVSALAPAMAQQELMHGYLFGQYPGRDVGALLVSPVDEINSSSSIESLTTFGLMQNEYDYLFEPAELGALKGWKRDRTIGNKWDPAAANEGGWSLITNLGNTALTAPYSAAIDLDGDGTVDQSVSDTSHSYQIGAWGKLGPGNLAFIAGYYSDKADSTSSLYTQSLEATPGDTEPVGPPDHGLEGTGASMGSLEHKGLDLYLAYGILLGESSSVGLSVRHVNSKFSWPDVSIGALSTETSTSYSEEDPTIPVSRQVNTSRYAWSLNHTLDRTADIAAAEFKIWPSSAWSVKARLQYAKLDADVNADTLFGSSPAIDGYLSAEYDATDNYATVDNALELQTRSTALDEARAKQDLSWDGHEWTLGGRLDWYRDAGQALQFDLAYTTGDFTMKNATPWTLASNSVSAEYANFPDQGLIEDQNHVDSAAWTESIDATDLSTKRLSAGVRYLWQWDQADFLIGARYRQDKAEARWSGAMAVTSVLSDTVIMDLGPPPTYTSTAQYTEQTGVASFVGQYETKRLELPIAAELHVNDALSLRFGAMHVFDDSEATASNDWLENHYVGISTQDGEEVGRYTDDVTVFHDRLAARDKQSLNYTLYRAGLAYKFNDHVIAELMVTEHSGDAPTHQEAIGLDKIVASASFRF